MESRVMMESSLVLVTDPPFPPVRIRNGSIRPEFIHLDISLSGFSTRHKHRQRYVVNVLQALWRYRTSIWMGLTQYKADMNLEDSRMVLFIR